MSVKRRHLILGAGAAVAATAGCLGNGTELDVSTSVRFPRAAVAGDAVQVTVTVENEAESGTTYEAPLEVDGTVVTEETVSLEPGERATLALSHTPDEPGERELVAAGEETVLTVYRDAQTLFEEAEFTTGTRVTERSTVTTGEFIVDGVAYDFDQESSATIRTDFEAETQYSEEETTTTALGETEVETVETWIVDGTAYRRVTDHAEDAVTHDSEDSTEFEDTADYSDPTVSQHIEVTDTAEQYVFEIGIEDPTDAAAVWEAIAEENEEVPPEAVTRFGLEARVDRQTLRPARTVTELTVEGFEEFSVLEMTVEEEFVEFGVPVSVTVPEEVRESLDRQDSW